MIREFALRDVRRRPVRARCSTAARTHGVNPGFALGASRRAPTACSSRSPSSARGPTSTGWPTCSAPRWRRSAGRGGDGMSAATETPLQREAATTIFEKGAPGRRAFSAPTIDVPERRRAAARPPPARRARRAARGLRARDRAPLRQPLQAQLRPRLGLLPARLVHDEAQPAPARARRGAARPRAAAPAPGPGARPGRARADVEPRARAGGDLRPAARLAAAERRARTASWPACC